MDLVPEEMLEIVLYLSPPLMARDSTYPQTLTHTCKQHTPTPVFTQI